MEIGSTAQKRRQRRGRDIVSSSEQKKLAEYWLQKACESLQRAKDDVGDGAYSFAISRMYYAVFYAVCAALADKGEMYGKHSAVRSVFNRDYVKGNRVSRELGELYNVLYDERNEGNYTPFVSFELSDVEPKLEMTHAFIDAFSGIVDQSLADETE